MNTQVNDPKGAAGALKAPMHLIPPYATEQTSWVHKLGSEKYGPYNWRDTGVCATTYVSAIMRHLNAWRDGEDLDPESGISHIAHIATSCNILLDAGHCGTLQDDRNKKPVPNTFAAAVAKAEAEAAKGASVALDQRDLPIPSEWNLPPIPEGYDRWVYRGTFRGIKIIASDRHILYSLEGASWTKTIYFSGGQYHIEAVKEESVAPDKPPTYPPVPKGYDRWVYRGKGWSPIHRVSCFATATSRGLWAVYKDFFASGCPNTHYIEAVKTGSTAPYGLPPHPPVPEGYTRWVYRGMGWKTDRRVCFAATTSPYIGWVTYKNGCTVGYEHTCYIEAVKD